MARTLEYYRRLPYRMQIDRVQDSDGSKYWTAEYIELRGCKADGPTELDAISNLHEVFDEYILTQIENGISTPEPAQVPLIVDSIWLKPWKETSFLMPTPPGVDTDKTGSEAAIESVYAPF
ncbi:MAG: hypothetical protein V1799_08320 [bacterium]